ncbi:MAG: pyridoxal-phosphate dependent enzyme [Candidatus Dojkabacteria bacterium]|nr:pyridoxal-phosphate dependent enzyme [Candidatus Dojkabacteria bacterium]MDQ7020888.1 pyridoxal-phosphate dependent enzyme [Candidatus Dojkabacteria bacterium]
MIWKYKEIKKHITQESNRISLNEGNTPVSQFSDGNNKLFIKREDLNPTGSWKDRGTAFKISKLKQQGISEVVIASSGNAAISLLEYSKLVDNFKVIIAVSPNLNNKKKEKLETLLEGTVHKIIYDTKAKRAAVRIANENKATLLKSSIDEDILYGYWSLGFELYDLIKYKKNENWIIFAQVSSGSTFVGIAGGLFFKLETEVSMPRFVACQTTKCHPLVQNVGNTEDSLADAIVDKSLLRKPQIEKIIRQTNGEVLAITNEELKKSSEFMTSNNIEDLSYTSLLSIAGYLRMRESLNNTNIICITSGR